MELSLITIIRQLQNVTKTSSLKQRISLGIASFIPFFSSFYKRVFLEKKKIGGSMCKNTGPVKTFELKTRIMSF